ncbi:hypothetical protein ACWEWX_40320, partial [Streptomyces asiaticus]
LGLAAANKDPQIRPDGTRLTGGNNAFLSFGHGEHRCPVAAQEIAETIARTAIDVLLDRLPDIDLAIPAEELTRRPSPWARGMTTRLGEAPVGGDCQPNQVAWSTTMRSPRTSVR